MKQFIDLIRLLDYPCIQPIPLSYNFVSDSGNSPNGKGSPEWPHKNGEIHILETIHPWLKGEITGEGGEGRTSLRIQTDGSTLPLPNLTQIYLSEIKIVFS